MAAAVAAALAAAGGQGQRLLRGCGGATVRPPRFSGAQGLVVWARFRFQFRVWARQGWGAWGWRRSLFDAVGCTIVDACQVCRRSVQMGAHVADVGAPAPQRWRQLSFLVQKLLATPWKVDVDWRPQSICTLHVVACSLWTRNGFYARSGHHRRSLRMSRFQDFYRGASVSFCAVGGRDPEMKIGPSVLVWLFCYVLFCCACFASCF